MIITIHRGANEIGGTCIQIESEGASIVIDAGLPLVDEQGEEFTGSPESVLPAIPGMFKPGKVKPLALLLTHAHMDHFGLFSFVDENIPAYSSEGTKRLIGITSVFSALKFDAERIISVKPWKPFSIGPFKLTPYLVDHSSFDAFAWLVEAEGKRVLYTGDIRARGRKNILFENLINKGPKNLDAILLEGTTIDRPDPVYNSETEVEEEIARMCHDTEGLIIVFSSGQNIDRMVSLYKAAANNGREFVIDIYVAHVLRRLSGIARIPTAEWDKVHVFYPYYLTKRLAGTEQDDTRKKEQWLYPFKAQKISSEALRKEPKRYVMVMRPSMWSDIDNRLDVEGAQAIWSMWSGYLAKGQNDKLKKVLQKHGVPLKQVHFGGHAGKDELIQLVEALSPKKVIPIHTFHADKYSTIFPNVQRISDGQPLIL